jgi:hypothetical protein
MKKNISLISIIDIIIYGTIIWFIGYAKYKSADGFEAFLHVVREDGWVEYLTTLFLIMGAVIFGINAVKAIKKRNAKQILFYVLSMLVFIFGAGEEISWGQRIFSIESSEYFLEKNYQGETNLHNLEIGGVDLNILIFSQLMFIVLIFYFVFLPILTYKTRFFKKQVLEFGVPIPRLHHTIMLLATNIFIIVAINMKKESELHELALTGIFFLVLLNPAKRIKDFILKTNTIG